MTLDEAMRYFGFILESAEIGPVQITVDGRAKEALSMICEAINEHNVAVLDKMARAHRSETSLI